MKSATNILKVFQLYNGDTWIFPLFLLALVYLLVRLDKLNRRRALLAVLAAVLIIFNDVSFWIISRVHEPDTYYRFLWIIPVVPLLAYVFADLLIRAKGVLAKGAVIAASALLIMLAGDTYLPVEDDIQASGIRYLNGSVVEISRMINEDKSVRYPKVACDISLVMSLRVYEPKIRNAISRWTYENDATAAVTNASRRCQHRLMKIVNGEKIKAKNIKKALKQSRTHYVVIYNKYERDALMEKAGCTVLGRTAAYTVYRVPEKYWKKKT